ncbi:MAG: lipolytic protein family [Mucilaginibacter sp.]|jgi:lysophospholipase L1-like esterase|nr:lipolytic protein family [Mucilaginibacter sp.]
MKYLKYNLLLILLSLSFLCFTLSRKKVVIYSIGDSTMAQYDQQEEDKYQGGKDYPLRGWMMMMPDFFNDNVVIHNAAVSGRSTKNFREEGYWKKVIDSVKPKDYVFIQFGHNDEKTDSVHHTDPKTTFRQNLINYIVEVKQKRAYPVLITSITRRKFDDKGILVDTHGEYVTVVRELAHDMKIPLIDLAKKTSGLIQSLGPEESKKLFLNVDSNKYTRLPNGKHDNTHLNVYGATRVSALAAQCIQELHLPLARYLIKSKLDNK